MRDFSFLAEKLSKQYRISYGTEYNFYSDHAIIVDKSLDNFNFKRIQILNLPDRLFFDIGHIQKELDVNISDHELMMEIEAAFFYKKYIDDFHSRIENLENIIDRVRDAVDDL